MEIKNTASERVPVAEGTYPARLVNIIDYGTQKSSNPKFKPYRSLNWGLQLVDEVIEILDENEEPTGETKAVVVYRRLPVAFGKKSAMGKILKAWKKIEVAKGESYDFNQLLDEPCLVTIVHNESKDDDRVFDNIDSITAPMAKQKVSESTEPVYCLSLDDDFDQDTFDGLPEWQQDLIKESKEYKEMFSKKSSKKVNGKVSSKHVEEEDEEEEEEQPKRKPITKGKSSAPAKKQLPNKKNKR